MGTTTSAKPAARVPAAAEAAGVPTASTQTAAVRTVIAMPAETAGARLNAVDVIVDQGAFRTAPRAREVVFIHHETLRSVVEVEQGAGEFHVSGFPRRQPILQMMSLYQRIACSGQNRV